MKKIYIFAFVIFIFLIALFALSQIKSRSVPSSTNLTLSPVGAEKKSNYPKTNAPDCDLSAYGMDCAVAQYLEKNIAWTVSPTGVDFCSYELMNSDPAASPLYLYAACQEFYVDNNKIYEASGTLIPVKLTKTDPGYSHWTPRDGSLNDEDMAANFPAQYRSPSKEINYDKLQVINRQRAQAYFNADFDYQIEKRLDQECKNDIDCQTPMEYLLMSRCPFASKCLNGNCAVVCPNFHKLN